MAKKTKRIFAFGNSHVSSADRSGGDIRFVQIIKRINGFEKIIITSEIGMQIYKKFGLNVEYLITTSGKQITNIPLTYILRTIKAIFFKPIIKEGDILYSASDFLPDVLPACVWKLKNKKIKWIQLIFHLIPSNRFISHYAQRISFFFIKRFADLIIVDNNLLKNDLALLGFDVTKIEFNSPGIEVEYFKTIKNIKDKRYDVVFLGRIHQSKGIFDLVNIWKYVCEIKPHAKLAIIGRGHISVERSLIERIELAELEDNIDVLGFLEANKAFETMKASRIFISPSHEEGFGISILEAMACGLPVVAWDLPVYRDIFPKGILRVPEWNIEEFADTVLRLLDCGQLYESLSRETNDVCQRYNWDKIVKRELKLLETLIED